MVENNAENGEKNTKFTSTLGIEELFEVIFRGKTPVGKDAAILSISKLRRNMDILDAVVLTTNLSEGTLPVDELIKQLFERNILASSFFVPTINGEGDGLLQTLGVLEPTQKPNPRFLSAEAYNAVVGGAFSRELLASSEIDFTERLRIGTRFEGIVLDLTVVAQSLRSDPSYFARDGILKTSPQVWSRALRSRLNVPSVSA